MCNQFIGRNTCGGYRGGSRSGQGEPSHHGAGLTLRKERGQEGGWGSKSLRLQHSSEKVLARLMGNPFVRFACWRSPMSQKWAGTARLSHWLGAAWGKHGFDVNSRVDAKVQQPGLSVNSAP